MFGNIGDKMGPRIKNRHILGHEPFSKMRIQRHAKYAKNGPIHPKEIKNNKTNCFEESRMVTPGVNIPL